MVEAAQALLGVKKREVAGSRFAYMKEGKVYLVPDATKIHGKICILAGLEVPFVLRKGGWECALVGDAYVHGMVCGEAWGKKGFQRT
jgi:hypothetical protein